MSGIIFVVEDDQDTRELLGYIIGSVGLEAKLFAKIEFALENLGLKPGLVLLDFYMYGSEVPIREFVNEAKKGGARVILVSGVAKTKEKAEEIGADSYLEKPFDLDDLLGEVMKIKNPAINGVLRATG